MVIICVVLLVSVLLMMGAVTVLAYFSLKNNGNSDQISYESIIPAEIKDNIIISKQFNYKFNLPADFQVVTSNKWNSENIYTEFLVYDGKKSVSTVIYTTDGSDFDDGKNEFHRQAVAREIIRLSYKDFDEEKLEFVDFCGLPCAHYAGISNSKLHDGQDAYIDKYTYVSPYCKVDFMVTCSEDQVNETEELFQYFKDLN